MRDDSVVEPVVTCPMVIRNTGCLPEEETDIVRTDEASDIISRHYKKQITDENDLEIIKYPEITLDAEATEHIYNTTADIFDGILPVEKQGIAYLGIEPVDDLVRLWGVQEFLIDLALRPELVHKFMSRLTDALLYVLKQYEEKNLLSLNNREMIAGQGGHGYTDEQPGPGYDPAHVKPSNLWGSSTAQIFSEVSPAMHEEFSLEYELRWLKQFGLTYYGCCEPLHRKIDILKRIPNLRKISMSPWVNIEEGAEAIGNNYVFSYKPNPAIFAQESWDLEYARKDLEASLKKMRKHNCIVEVIMKDVSTVRYKPHRLWEWVRMAVETTERFA